MNSAYAEIERDIVARRVPGLTARITSVEETLWQMAFGVADIEADRPMRFDNIQNIASISKTVVATAIMQLYEAGKLDLDRPVDDYLGFPFRNPTCPKIAITLRLLMTHRASLRDGGAYVDHYTCGDPTMSLDAWIRALFLPDGHLYGAGNNFNSWSPGETLQYNNLGLGVMALVVEKVASMDFRDYCRDRIFVPLDMTDTAWRIADIDISRHVAPYVLVEKGIPLSIDMDGKPVGIVDEQGASGDRILADGLHRNCIYNHPNYPDGFLRTTPDALTLYARAYCRDSAPLLMSREAMAEMFIPHAIRGEGVQGLIWYAQERAPDGNWLWCHQGRDPGTNTMLIFGPERATAAIVFSNLFSAGAYDIASRLIMAASFGMGRPE